MKRNEFEAIMEVMGIKKREGQFNRGRYGTKEQVYDFYGSELSFSGSNYVRLFGELPEFFDSRQTLREDIRIFEGYQFHDVLLDYNQIPFIKGYRFESKKSLISFLLYLDCHYSYKDINSLSLRQKEVLSLVDERLRDKNDKTINQNNVSVNTDMAIEIKEMEEMLHDLKEAIYPSTKREVNVFNECGKVYHFLDSKESNVHSISGVKYQDSGFMVNVEHFESADKSIVYISRFNMRNLSNYPLPGEFYMCFDLVNEKAYRMEEEPQHNITDSEYEVYSKEMENAIKCVKSIKNNSTKRK